MCAPYLFSLIQNAMNSLSFNGIISGFSSNFPSNPGFYADIYLTFIRMLWVKKSPFVVGTTKSTSILEKYAFPIENYSLPLSKSLHVYTFGI